VAWALLFLPAMTTTKRPFMALTALLAAFATGTAACGQESWPDPSEGQPASVTGQDGQDAGPAGRECGSTFDAATRVFPEPRPPCGKWGQLCCGQPGDGVCDLDNVCLQFDNWCSPRFTGSRNTTGVTCNSTHECQSP
jgi:hypothetical protein